MRLVRCPGCSSWSYNAVLPRCLGVWVRCPGCSACPGLWGRVPAFLESKARLRRAFGPPPAGLWPASGGPLVRLRRSSRSACSPSPGFCACSCSSPFGSPPCVMIAVRWCCPSSCSPSSDLFGAGRSGRSPYRRPDSFQDPARLHVTPRSPRLGRPASPLRLLCLYRSPWRFSRLCSCLFSFPTTFNARHQDPSLRTT